MICVSLCKKIVNYLCDDNKNKKSNYPQSNNDDNNFLMTFSFSLCKIRSSDDQFDAKHHPHPHYNYVNCFAGGTWI